MTHYVVVLYICQFGGLLMVIGGMVLLYKQKIDINKITKQLEISVPFFGKLRTNTPALALFVIGVVLLVLPIQQLKTEYLHVEQDVESNIHPVLVYAVVNTKSLPSGKGHLDLSIPILSTEDYSPELIYVAGEITDHEEVKLKTRKNGLITLREKRLNGRAIPDVSGIVVPPPERFK